MTMSGFINSLDQTNVFVKYLPADIDDEGLRSLFSSYGEIISSKVMIDHQTGLSLGYGYGVCLSSCVLFVCSPFFPSYLFFSFLFFSWWCDLF